MTFDRDIRIVRMVSKALLIVNLSGAMFCVWTRQWIAAVAFLIWCGNLVVWSRVLRVQQRTRDQIRIMEAALEEFYYTRQVKP